MANRDKGVELLRVAVGVLTNHNRSFHHVKLMKNLHLVGLFERKILDQANLIKEEFDSFRVWKTLSHNKLLSGSLGEWGFVRLFCGAIQIGLFHVSWVWAFWQWFVGLRNEMWVCVLWIVGLRNGLCIFVNRG